MPKGGVSGSPGAGIARYVGGVLQRTAGSPRVVVGYSQGYAVYVHENLEAYHPTGQAKFLETPARSMARELVQFVASMMRRRMKLRQALYLAGLRLQAASQALCPVDTGALRASAFTRIVEG